MLMKPMSVQPGELGKGDLVWCPLPVLHLVDYNKQQMRGFYIIMGGQFVVLRYDLGIVFRAVLHAELAKTPTPNI